MLSKSPSPPRGRYVHSPYLVTPERVRGGESIFEPLDVQDSAFGVHLGQYQPAGLRHAQAMPEHQELEAPVTGCVATAFRGFLSMASRSAMYTLSRIVL